MDNQTWLHISEIRLLGNTILRNATQRAQCRASILLILIILIAYFIKTSFIHTLAVMQKGARVNIFIIIITIIMLSVAVRQRLLPSLDCCSPFISLL